MNNKTKLIICDFDGPINWLTEAKRIAIIDTFKSSDVEISEEIVGYILNYIDYFYINFHILDYEELLSRVFAKMNEEELLVLDREIALSFARNFKNTIFQKLVPNRKLISVFESLKNENQELKVCIYTNQLSLYVGHFLDNNNIDASIFDSVYGSEHFNERKPSLLNLRKICLEQDVQFHETIMIGDDPVQDLLPARLLGIKTILFNENVQRHLDDVEKLYNWI